MDIYDIYNSKQWMSIIKTYAITKCEIIECFIFSYTFGVAWHKSNQIYHNHHNDKKKKSVFSSLHLVLDSLDFGILRWFWANLAIVDWFCSDLWWIWGFLAISDWGYTTKIFLQFSMFNMSLISSLQSVFVFTWCFNRSYDFHFLKSKC